MNVSVRAFARRLRTAAQVAQDRLLAFGPADLAAALGRAGVARGGVLFVHGGWDYFRGFAGKPSDVLRVLRNRVGGDGTLLMPSMPFTGSSLDWVRNGAKFDLARTPSRMGLVTELFRRDRGTLRSEHPTHPVL